MSFYFYDIIYFTKKIFAYQELDELLVLDQFRRVSSIGYMILGVGVSPHVTLLIKNWGRDKMAYIL